jgi:hypothetical protein
MSNIGGGRPPVPLKPENVDAHIGKFIISPASAQASGLNAVQIEGIQTALRSVVQRCTLISIRYNQAAIDTGKDARLSVDREQLARDQAELESLFADEFRFVDPFGVVGNKQSTILNILTGKIRRDSFESTDTTLELYGRGTTAISKGTFEMKGSVRVRSIKTQKTNRRDISGVYHTTHTYVFRDERWQLAASQLTKDPTNIDGATTKLFTHGPPEDPKNPMG